MREVAHPSLARLTTLKMGGYAQALLFPETLEDLDKVSARAKELGGQVLALGFGSNILAHDGELPLVLVRPAFPHVFERLGVCPDGRVLVRVSSSYPLQKLLKRLALESLSGLEGLAGIPGTVGGALAMNAGSFGCDMGSSVESISFWQNGTHVLATRPELSFSYRSIHHPLLTGDAPFTLITEAILALRVGDMREIRATMARNLERKRATQPVTAHSAGCVFKNPPSAPAGRLLEEAGCKGKQLGGVAFSTLHANFLLNVKQGRASEALELLAFAKNAVFQMSGIVLQPEVRIVPCMRR